ncbi:MAG: histidine kinase dimerization/phosphoacceptor domain -containing protein [Tistlia sp.]|uniref:histidine kinase dimerization/phosphoacceptor domain -containing protein n=1 Tax=Tistlia sp. TaxID=3057121 RepID=UPI0034A16C20
MPSQVSTAIGTLNLAIDPRSRRYPSERTAALFQHEEALQREVHHRIGNSLQLIASILSLDAHKVHSEEARLHLENARRRILAVATVQQQLQASGGDFELAAYLRQLCRNLTASVVGDATRIAIDVRADACVVSSAIAMKVGLIVTELVINALKHAFLADAVAGKIMVTFRVKGRRWRLTVADNGVGKPTCDQSPNATGMGTGIVAALVRQLEGRIETSTGLNGSGTSISITSRSACPTHYDAGEEITDGARIRDSAREVKGKGMGAVGKTVGDGELEAEGPRSVSTR